MTLPEVWIDVGGTFTDCILSREGESPRTFKLLSSGVTKGQLESLLDSHSFRDEHRRGDPVDFWIGYECRILDEQGATAFVSEVRSFDASTGTLVLKESLPHGISQGAGYELTAGEEAPVVGIRFALGLKLADPIPPVSLKLGTTRGTNALLTRTGARTALITTRGMKDVLRIGNQARPKLFELAIKKPSPLFEAVAEIEERLDASGQVLQSPREEQIREVLQGLKQRGIESIAICLLHSYLNSSHEELVARIAREVGFEELSVSSQVSPLIKLVSRGDTTVVDAYLNPVLREYVESIHAKLSAGSVQMMTSAGGLVDARHFVGKDSILSGPAGGVIGYSRVAQRAGFPKSIGFDMGGTSTDVSRFDGSYDREFETEKAGVRIVAPMLAIETVAAGGGSICAFDGVQLKVGPESAGSNPGPACYGRGGPLTVTDLNLFLGKILPEYFPFPLNKEVVQRRLEQICDEIRSSSLNANYTPHELAEGFVRIANANMVRAIRKISVAKGYDPADYVLVTFGGAGAQHACALARSLGIKQILIHPYAGILSAYGMGLADVMRYGERSVLKPCDEATLRELETVFQELEQETRARVLAEGVSEQQIVPPKRFLEMRYRGVEATILVPQPEHGDYARRYQELHQQQYGYVHEQKPLEITAARVEVVGRMPEPGETTTPEVPRVPEPVKTTETWFGGQAHSTGVFVREQLQAGDEISGPAIVCEPTSTVVIDPGFQATIPERGEILLTDVTGSSRAALSTESDPVMLEIFNNLFASIAEQMGVTLQKTSFSTNVKERLDFSCAIFSPSGDLVVNAPHIPVHLGAMSETVKRILRDNPETHPGDVFVTNDPYRGGSHLPDVTVVTPVHGNAGEGILFWTASRAHHAEIGGIVPGSMPPFSRNLAEEGVLIRNFKLVDRGKSHEEELRRLLLSEPYPTRSVEDNLSDISAQVAANASGVRQLQDLIERYTLPVVQAYMGHIQSAAATKMRLALQAIPSGVYRRVDHLDDGSPIAVTISIEGDRAKVDFTGTGPVLASNLNANRAIVTAAVLYVFRCLIDEEIPLNGGVLEPVELIVPEGLLNPPERENPAECAAMVGGNVETSQRVVDVLLGALELAAASQGTMNNLTFGNERFGYYETICGGSGATPNFPGVDAIHTHMTNTRLTDVEVLERRYPVRVQEFSIRTASGGKGRFSGGNGVIRRLEFLASMKVSVLSERRNQSAPFGLRGGGPGRIGRNLLLRAGESEPVDLGGKLAIDVQPGDVLTIETPGGGGCGSQES